MDKKLARLRRARKTRAKIAELKAVRLTVYRSNCHIYAQIFSGCGTQVLASASTAETEVRSQIANGGNVKAATIIGKLIAERAKAKGIDTVTFDRSGFHYHGRVKALAEAAREGGLKF
ncbi:MAG: 50S ribosomal protein L18 [Betaproteobacteria bacterium]|nr:50S ribosomal protein L18 [Betaproteobacteria bacterium]